VTGALVNQGGTGATGPAGSIGQPGPTGQPGSQGQPGEDGTDGREVEFNVEDNILQWRYVGETTWNSLDLELGQGGSGSIINTSSNTAFTHWIFAEEALSVPFPTLAAEPTITDQTAYVASKVSDGYTAINTVSELANIKDDMSGRYVLAADLDLSTRDSADVELSPYNVILGEYIVDTGEYEPFSGIFDGAGFTLSDFILDNVVDGGTLQYAGLFHSLAGATVRNLELKDFDYVGSGQSYEVGTLAAYVDEANQPTLVDNVTVTNFTFSNINNFFYYLGGLIGRQYSNSTLLVYRTTTDMSVTVSSTNASSYGGAILGSTNGNLVLGNINGASTYQSEYEVDAYHRYNHIGGAIGEINGNSSVQVDAAEINLEGRFGYEVGGLFGTQSGGNLSLSDSTLDVDLWMIPHSSSGFQFGGIGGEIESGSVVFVDNVVAESMIQGKEELGGFFGKINNRTAVRLENSNSLTNISGSEDIGGVVGYVNEGTQAKVVVDNVNVVANVSNNLDYDGNVSQSLQNVGGVFGYTDYADTSNQTNWNQFWVRHSDVTLTITIEPFLLAGGEDEPSQLVTRDSFDNFGGAFGHAYEDAFIRLTNNAFDTTVDYLANEFTVGFFYAYLGEIGGLIGYLQDESFLLFLNNDASLTLNVSLSDLVSLATEPTSGNLTLENIGGVVGDVDGTNIIDVAGSYALDINVIAEDNDLTNLDIDFSFYNLGGYAGRMNQSSTLIAEAITVGLTFDLSLTLLADSTFDRLTVSVQTIGAFIGEMRNFAFLRDINFNIVRTISIPMLLESDNVDFNIQEQVGFTGNNFSFFILTASE
jgi:hypothetical protein